MIASSDSGPEGAFEISTEEVVKWTLGACVRAHVTFLCGDKIEHNQTRHNIGQSSPGNFVEQEADESI